MVFKLEAMNKLHGLDEIASGMCSFLKIVSSVKSRNGLYTNHNINIKNTYQTNEDHVTLYNMYIYIYGARPIVLEYDLAFALVDNRLPPWFLHEPCRRRHCEHWPESNTGAPLAKLVLLCRVVNPLG